MLALTEGESKFLLGKERDLTEVWVTRILFSLISGDSRLANKIMWQRIEIWTQGLRLDLS